MQMAMVLTSQKPAQRNRHGEVPEGLPGSTLERGRREEKRQELERSSPLLTRGRTSQPNEGRLMAERESDPLVVLGGWESHLQGEGVDRNTPPAKETWAGHERPDQPCQPHCWLSDRRQLDRLLADASISEEPGASKRHAGICAGGVG